MIKIDNLIRKDEIYKKLNVLIAVEKNIFLRKNK